MLLLLPFFDALAVCDTCIRPGDVGGGGVEEIGDEHGTVVPDSCIHVSYLHRDTATTACARGGGQGAADPDILVQISNTQSDT